MRSKAGNKKCTPVRDNNVPSVVGSVGTQQPVFPLERRPKRGGVQVEYRVCPTYRAGSYRRLPSPTRVTRVNENPRDPTPFLGTADFQGKMLVPWFVGGPRKSKNGAWLK